MPNTELLLLSSLLPFQWYLLQVLHQPSLGIVIVPFPSHFAFKQGILTQAAVSSSQRYGTLMELGEKRKDMLEKSCKKFMLFREANELQQWINEKEGALTNEEVGSDLEQVEVLQKKFDDFQKVTEQSCPFENVLCFL